MQTIHINSVEVIVFHSGRDTCAEIGRRTRIWAANDFAAMRQVAQQLSHANQSADRQS